MNFTHNSTGAPNITPYYARLMMASEPDLAGAFETRSALADLLSPSDQLGLWDFREDAA